MTFNANIVFKYDSKWSYGGDEFLPEEHCTIKFPADDANTTQIFGAFRKFLLAIGHDDVPIYRGALSLAFNDMRSVEDMRKIAEEYDLIMIEDHRDKVIELEDEIENLKAKLSRLEQPDNPQYTDEELNAMSSQAGRKEVTEQTLKQAYKVCASCGDEWGEYSKTCSSWWQDKCDVCGQEKAVTEARDFAYLKGGIKQLSKGILNG